MDDLLKNYDHVRERLEELTLQMGDRKVLSDPREARRVGRERTRLVRLLKAMDAYRSALAEVGEAEELLEGSDVELQEIAREELPQARLRREETGAELKRLLTPRDPNDEKNAIVEIRAGTGGEEAALFVRDVFRMYSKYAGWGGRLRNLQV
jgi:peptide chain release factor 1